MNLDGPAILATLRRHEVDYVLIGGFAAVAHGSPILTNDVDVTPRREHDNLARLSAALTELDARVRAEGVDPLPFRHDADSLGRANIWNLTTRHGDLDITFTPSGTSGYDDLVRDAVEIQLRGTPVLLASLADIVRTKDAAGLCRSCGSSSPARPAPTHSVQTARNLECQPGHQQLGRSVGRPPHRGAKHFR